MKTEKDPFVEMIENIENELGTMNHGYAINYIDTHYNNAWSNAMVKIENALISKNPKLIRMEAAIYRDSVSNFLKQFKADQIKKTNDSFFSTLLDRSEQAT